MSRSKDMVCILEDIHNQRNPFRRAFTPHRRKEVTFHYSHVSRKGGGGSVSMLPYSHRRMDISMNKAIFPAIVRFLVLIKGANKLQRCLVMDLIKLFSNLARGKRAVRNGHSISKDRGHH